jgi:hypothetical protein
MVRIEHTNPQQATVIAWTSGHEFCPLCGGQGVVQLRRPRAARWFALIVDCPGTDLEALRSLLPRDTGSDT